MLKDVIYKDLVPQHSYIAVDQFKNMKALADYLQYLQRNLTAYGEYFRWRQTYKIVETYHESGRLGILDALCDLCEKLRNNDNDTNSTRRDIDKWFNSPDVCHTLPVPT